MKVLEEYILLSKEDRQSHIDLTKPCLERGGNSTNHRGVLAQYLGTFISGKGVVLAHACNNGNCSNPNHLYWATHYENTVEDGIKFGSHKSIWERTVEKYGKEEALRMKKEIGSQNIAGQGNRGKPKSEEHRRKIAESLRKRKCESGVIGSRN